MECVQIQDAGVPANTFISGVAGIGGCGELLQWLLLFGSQVFLEHVK